MYLLYPCVARGVSGKGGMGHKRATSTPHEIKVRGIDTLNTSIHPRYTPGYNPDRHWIHPRYTLDTHGPGGKQGTGGDKVGRLGLFGVYPGYRYTGCTHDTPQIQPWIHTRYTSQTPQIHPGYTWA